VDPLPIVVFHSLTCRIVYEVNFSMPYKAGVDMCCAKICYYNGGSYCISERFSWRGPVSQNRSCHYLYCSQPKNK